MPELAEIAKMARGINKFSQGKTFSCIVKASISKNGEADPPFHPFSVNATSRGKELLVTLSPSANGIDAEPKSLLMTMGLFGNWKYNNAKQSKKEDPPYTLLTFHADDGTKMMHCDKLRNSKWKFAEGFSSTRSPDPVKEFDDFVANIAKGFSRTVTRRTFKTKPIGEMMLNQKYFNGIGNYLRAEILHRANIHPLETTYNALLVKEPLSEKTKFPILLPDIETFDFKESIVLKLCHSFCKEMLDATFTGKRGKMKSYNRSGSSSFKDKNNRTVWYNDKQMFVIEPLDFEETKKALIPVKRRKRSSRATKTANANADDDINDPPRKIAKNNPDQEDNGTITIDLADD